MGKNLCLNTSPDFHSFLHNSKASTLRAVMLLMQDQSVLQDGNHSSCERVNEALLKCEWFCFKQFTSWLHYCVIV